MAPKELPDVSPYPAPRGARWGGVLGKVGGLIGPGVITGAADDDPSGIVTYSIAGAQLGTAMLWTSFLTWPLMSAVQMMCARVGMVTGEGLMRTLRRKFPKSILIFIGIALFLANTINVGADLSGMADVLHLLTGIANGFWVVLFGGGIIFATMRFRYSTIGRLFRWLAAFLFAYVVTAFLVHPNWGQIASATIHPPPITTRAQLSTLVAILGTTISPYLFFWQTAQEIEEEKAKGRITLKSRQGATDAEIITRKLDVGLGGFFSNMIMFFIILTAALTLHAHNITHIETTRDAVKALEPLAGRFATLLYAVGLIGVGFLAIPTLAGSAAYAFSETFGYRQGLDEKVHRARAFYGILSVSILGGVVLTFTSIKPIDALYWTAVINGILAPFLLTGILLVASDRKIMRGQPSSLLGRIVVGATALGMFAAALGLFLL